jgi:glutathione S-transferase
MTDTFTDGQTINLFESGSIMQYLVDRYDTEYKISFPKGTREWYEMNNWLFFQNAGVGPMQGQASKSSSFYIRRCGFILETCSKTTLRILGSRLKRDPFQKRAE